MALLVYSDLLPRLIHDSLMSALESLPGQQAPQLADALFRVLMPDGRNILEVIHKEGFMKKVATGQILMTPTPSTTIRLDELNNLLAEIAKGEDAVKALAAKDNASGMQTKKRDNTPKRGRDVGEPVKTEAFVPPMQAGPNEALTDEAIANGQLVQATRMKNEAKSLLAEAARLEAEAAAINKPAPVVKTPVVAKKKPGRPAGTTKNDTTKKASKTKV